MRAEHQNVARSEVTARVVERIAAAGPHAVAEALADTLYQERIRLQGARYEWEQSDVAYWKSFGKRFADSGASGQRELLHEVISRFTAEVMGSFDPRVYRVATSALPQGLKLLMNAVDPRRMLTGHAGQSAGLSDNVVLRGETEAVRALAQKGTLVVVPTHLSNMDSIVMGYAAYLVGLPPLLYGAGLNLFTNKLIGFFMNHLGAYRVDRRKKCETYKEVLKEYATFSMELGYHNLFFPGGTRSRGGGVERKLKKGLLGSALAAYQNNLRQRRRQPNLYVVPVTISYALVLEAQTLIEDYLQDIGKSRYIIQDDEFSRPRRIAEFMRDLLALDSKIYITFGEPLDPFGNVVDFQGRSLDPRGRIVDPSRYVCRDGEVVSDVQRDHAYTSELSAAIVRGFERHNRIQSTHLLAFVVHVLMRRAQEGADLYRVLREGLGKAGLPQDVVIGALDRLLVAVRRRADAKGIALATEVEGKSASEVLEGALRYFASYHSRRAVHRDGTRIQTDDPELVYYYHNRLAGYGFEADV